MANYEWINDLLEENPEILYQARRPQTRSRNLNQFYADRFDQIWNQYMGVQGRDLLSGVEPTQTFGTGPDNFLDNYPFLREYLGRSRAARGSASLSSIAPSVPWAV